jgi:hypothetical protein
MGEPFPDLREFNSEVKLYGLLIMEAARKYSIHYDFFFARYWLVLILAACVALDFVVYIKLLHSTDDLTRFLCVLTLICATLIAFKFAKLLLHSNIPVISIRDDRIILEGVRHLEIPFSDISSVQLASSGAQMFSRSLLIFLNNGLDNENSDKAMITVPLILIRTNGNHLLRLLRLYLDRKARDMISSELVMEEF